MTKNILLQESFFVPIFCDMLFYKKCAQTWLWPKYQFLRDSPLSTLELKMHVLWSPKQTTRHKFGYTMLIFIASPNSEDSNAMLESGIGDVLIKQCSFYKLCNSRVLSGYYLILQDKTISTTQHHLFASTPYVHVLTVVQTDSNPQHAQTKALQDKELRTAEVQWVWSSMPSMDTGTCMRYFIPLPLATAFSIQMSCLYNVVCFRLYDNIWFAHTQSLFEYCALVEESCITVGKLLSRGSSRRKGTRRMFPFLVMRGRSRIERKMRRRRTDSLLTHSLHTRTP